MAVHATYEVHGDAQTISTAITALQLTAPAAGLVIINRAWMQQSSNTTSSMVRVRILRKSAGITGTATPPTPAPVDGNAASNSTIAWVATAEGTDGTVIVEENFNLLNGWIWVPTLPTSRIVVPPSGIIALKFAAAPASSTWTFGFEFEEYA